MYLLNVEGAMLCAEYEKDNEQTAFHRKWIHRDSEPNSEEGGEILEVKLNTSESKDNLREVWVVIYGTPRQIVWTIQNNLPMAKLETVAILQHLNTVDAEQPTMLTYLLEEPFHVVRHSPLYQVLRSCQRAIVADLFDRKVENVHIVKSIPFLA